VHQFKGLFEEVFTGRPLPSFSTTMAKQILLRCALGLAVKNTAPLTDFSPVNFSTLPLISGLPNV